MTRTNQEMRNRPDMTAAAEGEPNRTEKIRGANAAGRMTPRIRRPVVVQGKGSQYWAEGGYEELGWLSAGNDGLSAMNPMAVTH